MKKLYTLLFILTASLSFGQAFTATYDFALVTATSGLTDPSTPPTAPGISFGSFVAVNPTATNSTASVRFSFVDQPLGGVAGDNVYANHTGVINLGTYFQVTITPTPGTVFDLSQITFRAQRSGTGIRTYAVRSSIDSYAANLPASISPANTELTVEAGNIFYRALDATTTGQNGSTITLSGPSYTGITSAVTFRFYGWNAEASTGSFSIDDVAISGTTTTLKVKQNAIAGLNMYPNPVINGNLYITSDSNEAKSVLIYDVLGKQVAKTTTANNTVNVANLKGGVYIVKVTEDGKTATRKLIIK